MNNNNNTSTKNENIPAMCTYTPANGYTKASIKKKIEEEFTGMATDEYSACRYLTEDGRKCAIGLFLPADEAVGLSGTVRHILSENDHLWEYMPLEEIEGLALLQQAHDRDINRGIRLSEQKAVLIKWVDTHVKDDEEASL